LASGASKPTAVAIKTGISDGISTEVTEGLKEGDRVVTGVIETKTASAPPANPFSGAGGGRGRRF
jgi:HlyD family secretion protein